MPAAQAKASSGVEAPLQVSLCQPGPNTSVRVVPGVGVPVGVAVGVGLGVGDGVGVGVGVGVAVGVGSGIATGAENSEVLPAASVAVAVMLGPSREPEKIQFPAPLAVVEPSYTLPSSSSSE